MNKTNIQNYYFAICKDLKIEPTKLLFTKVAKGGACITHNKNGLIYSIQIDINNCSDRLYFDAVDTDFVIDVATSICALECKSNIEPHHLVEAIQYSRIMIFECIDLIDKQIAHLKQERKQLLIKVKK